MSASRSRSFAVAASFLFVFLPPWSSARISTRAGACAAEMSTAPPVTLFVAPDGDDRWSGRSARPDAARTDGPLASLQGARDRIRALRREPDPPAGPITVTIAGGTYPITEAVDFEPGDGGTQSAPVVYQAAPGARPVFDGGRAIKGLQLGTSGLWVTKLADAAAGHRPFEQLFVNGRRAVRARAPNSFYYYMSRRLSRSADSPTGPNVPMGNRGFIGRPEDVQCLGGLSAEQLRDVNVVAYHVWEVSRHRIAAFHPETGAVILTGPAPWPFFEWGLNQRYHLENLREALDAPGEWFLDRDGTLSYKPMPGEEPATAAVVAPFTDALVRIRGRPEANQWVEHLSLRGLTFRHSGYHLPPEGHADSQAAVTIPAAVMADGARHVSLVDCRIEQTGTYGVWFRRGCQDCQIERCALLDLGAGGVRIGEPGVPADSRDQTGRITVHNTIIRGGGRVFPGAVGVWIGQASDNVVNHNDIADLFYTGISMGWSWGYHDTRCKRNIIEYNHIHHIGRGVLSDMGGVYTLGISTGSSVSHNVIHDVDSYDRYNRGGWGLYNDEGSTGIRLEDNLVYSTASAGYHQHYGQENLVRNNIFAFGRDGQIQRSRAEPHLSFTFERNIVYWKQGPLLYGVWSDRNFRLDHNLYFKAADQGVSFAGRSLSKWRAAGQDQHSQVADPRFVDPDRFDFRLKSDSPALVLGFKPFDFSQAGVNGDPEWIKEAAAIVPPAEVAPKPPPLAIREDFESPSGRAGDPYVPLAARVSHEGRPALVALSDQTAASGRQSLQLTDAAGLKHAFNPHVYFQPHYSEGMVVSRFALRLEPGAVFSHEWRDAATPYRAGPSLWIENGKLRASGRKVLDVPTGEWVHFEVRAGLGHRADGTWSLTIGRPGHPDERLTGLPCAAGWSSLDWIGFASNATQPSVIYLDDLELMSLD